MYAIAFDLEVAKLEEHYGKPYNNAYLEINKELKSNGFEWTQGSLYLSSLEISDLTSVYKAINALSKIDWFCKSLRDIRVFKVEEWSDFSDILKGKS